MGKVIKETKIELYYKDEFGNPASNLSSVESFCGHSKSGHYVGIYIHKNYDENGGAFHVFESMFPMEFSEIACFRYNDYSRTTLLDLESTLKENIDSTFTLDEVADDLSIFVRFLNE